MTVIRFNSSTLSTGQIGAALLDYIRDPKCEKIALFVTERSDDQQDSPWLMAVVTYQIPHVEPVHVLMDGYVLSAARYPRYMEVRDVLDAGEKAGKVWFCSVPAPFTQDLPADKSISVLQGLGSLTQLNASTRPQLFLLLSTLTEAQYEKSVN